MSKASNVKGGAAVAGAAHGSAALTLATLAAVMAEIPKPPPWRYCTVKPEHAETLRREIPLAQPGQLPITGIEIHEKHGQVADSWMFSDSKTLRKYLAGELSELDLIGLMVTGACQPNDRTERRGTATPENQNLMKQSQDVKPGSLPTQIEQPSSINGRRWFFARGYAGGFGAEYGVTLDRRTVEARCKKKAGAGKLVNIKGVWHWMANAPGERPATGDAR